MIISHPTGNQNARNAALAFERAGLLERFYTTVAWKRHSILSRILPHSIVSTLQRREYEILPKERVSTHPLMETCRHLAMILKIDALTRHETGLFCIDAVYRSLDSHTARQLARIPPPRGVYAYEYGALKTFQVANKRGVKTNYEVASAYLRAAVNIAREEADLNPEWAVTMLQLSESEAKFNRLDEEMALADNIIVASKFTAGNLSLANTRNKKIAIIPYGSPLPIRDVSPAKSTSNTLRVLFVGNLTQGKGLSYLFRAANLLKGKIALTVIGRRIRPCAPLDQQLEQCRYIPSLPHNEVLQEMQQHDVLVFPSLCDGFGLVILEAMSRGIPVIASTNCGGPDVITDGEDGYIVPIRSHDAIAEKLELLANDRGHLERMKAAALAKAKQLSWERYQSMLVKNVTY